MCLTYEVKGVEVCPDSTVLVWVNSDLWTEAAAKLLHQLHWLTGWCSPALLPSTLSFIEARQRQQLSITLSRDAWIWRSCSSNHRLPDYSHLPAKTMMIDRWQRSSTNSEFNKRVYSLYAILLYETSWRWWGWCSQRRTQEGEREA